MTEQKTFHDDANQGWMTETYIVKQVEACRLWTMSKIETQVTSGDKVELSSW